MIAISNATRRTMVVKGGTTIAWSATATSTYEPIGETTNEGYVVVADNGWRNVTVDDLEAVKIKEPVQEQDETDTGERPATWKRQNRRLATVNRAWRKIEPRKAASTLG